MPQQRADTLREFGSLLKQLREAQILTIEQVSEQTHIRPFILEAIEDGELDALSGLVYSHSFVKSYCEFLCADDLWLKYESTFREHAFPNVHLSSQIESQKQYTPPARAVFRKTSLAWVYMLLLFSVFVAGYLLWKQKLELTSHPLKSPENITSSDVRASVPVAPSADAMMLSTDRSLDSKDKNLQQNTKNVKSGDISADVLRSLSLDEVKPQDIGWMDGLSYDKHSKKGMSTDAEKRPDLEGLLLLNATERVWVGVYQGKQTLFSGFLDKGEKKEFFLKKRTRLRIGNPSYVRLLWEGVEKIELGRPGKPSTVYIDVKKNRSADRTQGKRS